MLCRLNYPQEPALGILPPLLRSPGEFMMAGVAESDVMLLNITTNPIIKAKQSTCHLF
ncbi:hypothetical protein PtA15_14A176 [Puccinia triticina]|uniref:Uncharacterized protein n=1 Tax=Puccinia triticina TaxID=208348 RepID=A0ABY7D155_9BASI|nr:uncharacterized protein PtA15_14A176 [Puccinia triticina]WAQ91294.1 hypothetical protein PtA15_14A176 [Puccinia triticina]WAR62098.1 hypothetical protein PtB15_14B192 [Puccinia triticina]